MQKKIIQSNGAIYRICTEIYTQIVVSYAIADWCELAGRMSLLVTATAIVCVARRPQQNVLIIEFDIQ